MNNQQHKIVPLQLIRSFATQGNDLFKPPIYPFTSFNAFSVKINNCMQLVKLVSTHRLNLKALFIDVFMDSECFILLADAIAKHVMPHLMHLNVGGWNGDIAIPLVGALQLGGKCLVTLRVGFWCEEDAIFLLDLVTRSDVCPNLTKFVVGPISNKKHPLLSAYKSRRPNLKIFFL